MGRVGRFGGVVITGRGVGIGCRWGDKPRFLLAQAPWGSPGPLGANQVV